MERFEERLGEVEGLERVFDCGAIGARVCVDCVGGFGGRRVLGWRGGVCVRLAYVGLGCMRVVWVCLVGLLRMVVAAWCVIVFALGCVWREVLERETCAALGVSLGEVGLVVRFGVLRRVWRGMRRRVRV